MLKLIVLKYQNILLISLSFLEIPLQRNKPSIRGESLHLGSCADSDESIDRASPCGKAA